MRDERSVIRPVDGASPAATSPPVLTMLKRAVIRGVLYARGTIGEAARAVADACGAVPHAGQLSTSEPKKVVYDPTQAAPSFADLPLYRNILKHKEIGRIFDIDDPFYRCHEARHGVTTQIRGRNYVNFASYDYLGLNQHPAVVEAAKNAIDNLGTSVSASRIVAGERTMHGVLERALADFCGVEAAIAFVSGHATNVSTISTLMTPDDLVLYDDLSHNSLIVGIRLSGATAYAFKHNDAEALEAL